MQFAIITQQSTRESDGNIHHLFRLRKLDFIVHRGTHTSLASAIQIYSVRCWYLSIKQRNDVDMMLEENVRGS